MEQQKNLVDLLRNKTKRRAVEWAADLFFKWRYDIRVSGLENIKSVVDGLKTPFVVVSNHECFWDGLMYGLKIPLLDFAFAKEECWLKWFYRFFVPELGGIPAVRKEKLEEMAQRYPISYAKYITDDGRFRFEKYLPPGNEEQLFWDIVQIVKQCTDTTRKSMRKIECIQHLDSIALAEYVLLKGKNLLHFYQGTRKADHSLNGERYGLFNIASDLSLNHGMNIPIFPSAIWYENLNKWGSRVHISIGEPHGIMPYLKRPLESRHEMFMSDIKEEIRSLHEHAQWQPVRDG